MFNNILIHLGIDDYKIYDDIFIMYVNIKSLCCILETNIILSVNYI